MDKGKILNSWKEISAYLGRNIRTCQNWEHELGLPVHRLEGSPKSRVFAYTAELDAWRDEKGRLPNGTEIGKESQRLTVPEGGVFGIKRIYLGLGLLAAVIASLVVSDVGGLRNRLLGRSGGRITSLAVLPVKDYSDDTEEEERELFADGMTDALINGFAQIDALTKVTARTSVMPYKDTKKSLRQVAKELGVGAIVEASVTRSGGRVSIKARLLEARGGRQLGPPVNYEREMTDVLALYSDVVRAIAGEMRIRLTPQEGQRLTTTRRVDPEVYEAALKGKIILEYANLEREVRQAIGLFQKAVDLDSTYAPAWAGLGEGLWYLAVFGFEFVDPAEVRDRSIAAADRALDLDDTLADAHMARAIIAIDGEWNIEKAEYHFKRAIELRPSYANACTFYGTMLAGQPLLRFDEASRYIERARELDPLSPWNDINLAQRWLFQGRPDKAFEEAERAWRRSPAPWALRRQMGEARLLQGIPSRAVLEFEAALESLRPERPAAFLGPLGLAYGLAGRRSDSERVLTEMEQKSHERYISPYYLAIVHSGLGQMDEAFRLLDQALESRTPRLVISTSHDPLSVALSRDPRWKLFLGRLKRLVKLPPGAPDPYF